MASVEQAHAALTAVTDAGSGRSLIELGWIQEPRLVGERAVFLLALPGFAQAQRDRIVTEARAALLAIDGVNEVQIELAQPTGAAPIGAAGHGAPGKGGVGKSTVAVNLACALAATGLKVGLLDADIYGPNAPTMLGVADRTPEVRGEGASQVLSPVECCGIAMVSMGLLIQENQPVVWRGPMLNGIIRQFLYQVEWGERDVLIVDLPPGTGDAQLTIAQAVPMAGAIIVTTPQLVSLADARRGLAMFVQMGVSVLGVVENMSVFIPPDAPEKRYALFGSGGGARLAEEAGVPLLAELPLEMPVREGGDAGRPVVLSHPESASAQALMALARRIGAAHLVPT